jgi:hypothetical protein
MLVITEIPALVPLKKKTGDRKFETCFKGIDSIAKIGRRNNETPSFLSLHVEDSCALLVCLARDRI